MTEQAELTRSRRTLRGIVMPVIILGTVAVSLFLAWSAAHAGAPQKTDIIYNRITNSIVQTVTATPAACLPSTIVGSITFDDQARNGSIEYDGIVSSCGAPKSCPPEIEDRLSYDAYTYVNSTGTAQCYTVTLDGTDCGVGIQSGVFSTAYLGSFDPNNACANYLADPGDYSRFSRGPISYSFSVPAGETFVVVVEEFYPAWGCDVYTLTISGQGSCLTPTPTSTPPPSVCPPSVVTGSITDGDPLSYESHDFTGASNCNNPKPCPPTIEGEFRYDQYTYVNSSSTEACVTVTVDGRTCGESFEGVYSATYLGSFDPNSVCTNYLADPGTYSDPVLPPSVYSFVVPAGATFVVVVQEVIPIVGCENYTLTVTGLQNCVTPTVTATLTATSTSTSTAVATSTEVPPTSTVVASSTASPQPTTCAVAFTDVPAGHTFYEPVQCLACRGIVSGYSDGTFRPNVQVTRGQLAKIVSNSAGFSEAVSGQTFEDVPPTNTFHEWIERLTTRGYMTGYVCGGVGEPCITGRPYFRPFANATRGQTAKIVANAAMFTEPPSGQTFEDVPPTHTFYEFIQRLASRNVMGGYPCGGPGEPCVSGKPYFRPGNDVTRGQSAKIVANTFFAECSP